MALKVSEDNIVQFKFWEKPTNANRTVQKRTAMSENPKIQILKQEMIRRLSNTKEDMNKEVFEEMIDKYSQKLINSGYCVEQTRRIVVAGIKGWEGKIQRCREAGQRLRRTAKDSLEMRTRRRLIGKTTWFKTKRKGQNEEKNDSNKKERRGAGDSGADGSHNNIPLSTPRSVLFVEQTPGG